MIRSTGSISALWAAFELLQNCIPDNPWLSLCWNFFFNHKAVWKHFVTWTTWTCSNWRLPLKWMQHKQTMQRVLIPCSVTFCFHNFMNKVLCFQYITKTCLYNIDPLKPHFHIVKLGFTGVYIIFLFLLKNIDCGYSLEPPPRGGSNEYPQSMFWRGYMKNIRIFVSENFQFLEVKVSIYLNRRGFVMILGTTKQHCIPFSQ